MDKRSSFAYKSKPLDSMNYLTDWKSYREQIRKKYETQIQPSPAKPGLTAEHTRYISPTRTRPASQ